MRAILSNYNFSPTWLFDYDYDYLIYDRSDSDEWLKDFPQERIIKVPNIGSDIYDKFTFIIDNYDNLPDVALYSKSNIFKYITKEEFDKIKDNTTFTPVFTKNHKVYDDANGPVCFYDAQGMFNEVNNYWYLYPHPAMHAPTILDIFKMRNRMYNVFAPGSTYILTKEDIQKHPKKFYEQLRSFLAWDRYPGDAQLLERNLYYLWGTDLVSHENSRLLHI